MSNPPTKDRLRIGAMAEGADRWLDVQVLPDFEPLEGPATLTSGTFVPEGLEPVLFDDADQKPAQRGTFAVVDAAIYSFLPDLLETSGNRHKCLFRGKALKDNADAAPWLVELTPNGSFTRQLMSTEKSPGGLWEKELGIFVKSALSFDKLWSHLRKFTRIEDETGNWLYYRYWSAPVSTRVMALGNRPELTQMVSPFFPKDDPEFEVVLLNSDLNAKLKRVPGTVPPIVRPTMTTAAHRTIRQVRRVQQYEELIDITLRHVKGSTDLSDDDIHSMLRLKRDGFFDAGFWQRDHLVKLMVWEVLLGPEFIEHYASGTVKAIILSAKAPYEAIMNIEFFLEAQEIRRQEAEDI
ncbi:MAG: DUF4123 domain-containing protein [Litoreibacter sp.]|uniref:DUF4123 domain-containing protein n=1 Tax=Litoreibacter sp. TaxID=1969459 RepID=UPI00329A1B58